MEAGKPDALSRRPDYWPKGGSDPATRNEFTFLKPEQMEGFPSEANYMVCAAVAQSLDIDQDLGATIGAALPADLDIGPHLEQL